MSKLALLLSTAVIAVGVAACGSSNSSKSHTSPAAPASTPAATTSSAASTSSSTSNNLAISAPADSMLMFSTNSLHASAGKITITFTNHDTSLGHNFTLATSSGKVIAATPTIIGGTKSVTVTLKAGTYTYYCSVPGHRQAGMQGTLTVS
jgi:plastocyanin